MRDYRDHVFYLYKSTAYRDGAPILDEVNYHLKNHIVMSESRLCDLQDGITPEESEGLLKSLPGYIPEGLIYRQYYEKRWLREKGVISIYTSVDNAVIILKYLKFFASINELVLYDPQTDCCYFHTDRNLEQFVDASVRENTLIPQIRKNHKQYIVTKIGDEREVNNTVISYSITLIRMPLKTAEKQVEEFDSLLRSLLRPDEELDYKDDCFNIKTKFYILRIVLEGYKRAHFVGCIRDGKAFIKDLNRMGCYEASKILRLLISAPQEDVFQLMGAEELRANYPNPGDRYVAICKNKQYLQKNLPCVEYYSHQIGGGYVSINRVVSDYNVRNYNSKVHSYLMIDEDVFEAIIPCVEKHYPHFRDRYYEDNHISDLTTKDIIEEIKNTKKWLATYPESHEVKEYYKETHFSPEEYIDKKFVNMLFATMDYICMWLEMNLHAGSDFMINITGP